MYSQFLQKLSLALEKDLPGEKAHQKMSPNVRFTGINLPDKSNCKKSAVMILFYPKADTLYVPFIQRNEYNGAHSGQISLPGGKTEPYDIDSLTTALRETHEEIGIQPENIITLGKLSPIYIPNSNYNVIPFVGYVKQPYPFKPDPYEVHSIIEAPLNQILSPKHISQFKKVVNGHELEAPFFNIKRNVIWGATAMIMSELKEIILNEIPNSIPLNFYNVHNAQ